MLCGYGDEGRIKHGSWCGASWFHKVSFCLNYTWGEKYFVFLTLITLLLLCYRRRKWAGEGSTDHFLSILTWLCNSPEFLYFAVVKLFKHFPYFFIKCVYIQRSPKPFKKMFFYILCLNLKTSVIWVGGGWWQSCWKGQFVCLCKVVTFIWHMWKSFIIVCKKSCCNMVWCTLYYLLAGLILSFMLRL